MEYEGTSDNRSIYPSKKFASPIFCCIKTIKIRRVQGVDKANAPSDPLSARTAADRGNCQPGVCCMVSEKRTSYT